MRIAISRGILFHFDFDYSLEAKCVVLIFTKLFFHIKEIANKKNIKSMLNFSFLFLAFDTLGKAYLILYLCNTGFTPITRRFGVSFTPIPRTRY